MRKACAARSRTVAEMRLRTVGAVRTPETNASTTVAVCPTIRLPGRSAHIWTKHAGRGLCRVLAIPGRSTAEPATRGKFVLMGHAVKKSYAWAAWPPIARLPSRKVAVQESWIAMQAAQLQSRRELAMRVHGASAARFAVGATTRLDNSVGRWVPKTSSLPPGRPY